MDHATSEQHTTAMAQMQADNVKASKVPLPHYALIAKCFSKMDAVTKERLKKKFDVCYLLAKENMAFLKYPAILDRAIVLSDDAIQIWWTNCSTSRRVNHAPRKLGSVEVESVLSISTTSTTSISTDADVPSKGSGDESDGTTQTIALADWDNWLVDKHDHGDLSS